MKRVLLTSISFCTLILVAFSISEINKDIDVKEEWKLDAIEDYCPGGCNGGVVEDNNVALIDWNKDLNTIKGDSNKVDVGTNYKPGECIQMPGEGGGFVYCQELDISKLPDFKAATTSDGYKYSNYTFANVALYSKLRKIGFYPFFKKVDIDGNEETLEAWDIVVVSAVFQGYNESIISEIGVVKIPNAYYPYSVYLSPTGRYLAFFSYKGNWPTHSSMVTTFDAETGLSYTGTTIDDGMMNFLKWIDDSQFLYDVGVRNESGWSDGKIQIRMGNTGI